MNITYNALAPIVEPDELDVKSASFESLPLSKDQSMLKLIHSLSDEGSLAYNNSIALKLKGKLDICYLQQAIDMVVERHSALRSLIPKDDNVQKIYAQRRIMLEEVHPPSMNGQDLALAITCYLEKESKQVFDLEKEVIRFSLFKVSCVEHLFCVTVHHIVSDGVSVSIILQEISTVYSALCKGKVPQLAPAKQFKDYLGWVDRAQDTPENKSQIDYWTQVVSKGTAYTMLPADFSRPSFKTYSGARVSSNIPSDLYQQLKTYSKSNRVTYFMLLEAVYNLFLHRASEQDKVSVGIAFSGRRIGESESLVGYCANLYPITFTYDKKENFEVYLKRIKGILLDAYENQDCKLSDIIERSRVVRDKSQAYFFSVAFNWDRVYIPEFHGLDVSYQEQPIAGTEYDLMPNIIELNDSLHISWDYNTTLFRQETITKFASTFNSMLSYLLKHPGESLGKVLSAIENISGKKQKKKNGIDNIADEREIKKAGIETENDPENLIEAGLRKIVEPLIGGEALSPDQDFFSAGLNSLSLFRCYPKIKKAFNVEFPVAQLFTSSSLKELTKIILELKKLSSE